MYRELTATAFCSRKTCVLTVFVVSLLDLSAGEGRHAKPGDRAVSGLTLKPFDCWDRAFESRGGHGCSSVVSVTFLEDNGFRYELIPCSEESYLVCVRVCVCLIVSHLETSKTGRPRSALVCNATEERYTQIRVAFPTDSMINMSLTYIKECC